MTDISRPIQTFVDHHGESATLTNYTQTGTDEYGDPTFSESTESAEMIFSPIGDGTGMRDDSGAEETVTTTIRIPTSATVNEPGDNTVKPTVITREATGIDYRVETKVDMGDGLYSCECEQL